MMLGNDVETGMSLAVDDTFSYKQSVR